MTDRSDIIQGEFDQIEAKRAHPMQGLGELLQRASRDRYNPIAVVHREAEQCLARLYVPFLSVSPSPEQFEFLADFALKWAKLGDRVMKAIGEETRSNS